MVENQKTSPLESCDVLLVNPPYPMRRGGGLVPPIGLCYLASSLRAHGAKPRILDLAAQFPQYRLSDAESVAGAFSDFLAGMPPGRPRLIGIGPLVTATLRSTRHLISACRGVADSAVVLGGPLCAAPGIGAVNQAFLQADFLIAGDGEEPIAALWRSLRDGKSPATGGSNREDPKPHRHMDVDLLPLPARDLVGDSYHSSARRLVGAVRATASFLSRGCPYNCAFCAAPLSSGTQVRHLSPARITQEIRSCGQAGFEHIVFYDDCMFAVSQQLDSEVARFAEAVAAADWGGTFQLELRCDAVVALSDHALADLLAVGCRQINMGIEKASVLQLERLGKNLQPTSAQDASHKLAAAGIRSAGSFILGGPGETVADMEETIGFADSLPLTFAQFNPLALYPGTRLFFDELGTGELGYWLKHCLDTELAPMGDILWRSAAVPLDRILETVQQGYKAFYTENRLRTVASRLPATEQGPLADSYHRLANDRPLSWTNVSNDVRDQPNR